MLNILKKPEEKKIESHDEKKMKALDETKMDRNVVFHYSRDQRLERAPPSVQRLYGPNAKGRGIFINQFGARKYNRMAFLTIIALLLTIPFLTNFSRDINLPHVGNNAIHAVARVDRNGDTILTLRKTFKDESAAYTGEVTIAVVSSEMVDGRYLEAAFVEYFSLNPKEVFKLTIPFQSETFLVGIYADERLTRFRVNTRR